jgi:2-oxoglutarate ferredoxin oxidoreductase subunit beta
MEHALNISEMITAAGAPYVARWTTYHPRPLTRSIKKGIQKKGFALIEAVSQCPVQFGRVSKIGKAVDILKFFKENSIRIDKASGMSEEELEGKIIIGEFADKEKVELSSQWIELSKQMMQEEGESCHVKS